MELTLDPISRKYEAVIILHPDTSEDEQKNIFRKNQEIIKAAGGSINHLDTWGKRRLANAIKKIPRAIYFHTTFETQPEAIKELERTMKLNDRVLRYMHTKLDDRVTLSKFVEKYKDSLKETARRESERQAKFKKKR